MTEFEESPTAPIDATLDAMREATEDAATAIDRTIDELAGLPPEGRITRFSHDGAELVAEERGSGARTFVLVHGIGMGRKVFGDLTLHLEAHGRVIGLDLPGYGEAAEPPRTPTIERMADLVAAYLDTLTIAGETVVIGHSMGTQVVLEVAARHPEVADRIVLVAPTVDAAARHPLVQLARLGRDLWLENPRVLLLGAREYVRAGPHLRRKMRAMLVHRPEDAAPRVDVPALVIRGARDVVCPAAWCAEVASWLGADLVEIPDHGHETMIRDAAPAARAITAFIGV